MRKVKTDKFQKKLLKDRITTVNNLAREYLLISRRYFGLKAELQKLSDQEREKAQALGNAEFERQSAIDFTATQLGKGENENWEIDFETMDFNAPDLPKPPPKDPPKKGGKKGQPN